LSTPSIGLLYAYEDPHVSNCCAAWFCPAGTGAGYPKYAHTSWSETGYSNLAVFFYGCNFDCLFCQNYSHKNLTGAEKVSDDEFAGIVARNRRLSCICFFGGSPEPQLPYALTVSRRVLEENRGRIMRICFEWNGGGNMELVKRAAELSYASGGNIKFDLKCFEPALSMALSGVDNKRSYENFAMIAREYRGRRSELPMLTATTLLVPGYVDASEVESIARFISDLDRGIPYSLLVFHPNYLMVDLPVTPRRQVEECYSVAKRYLDRVHVGNLHLLA
jgi:pyruvate formate lyase activating enzyme